MLRQPLQGARWIAAFVAATARSTDLESEIHEINGQPALVFYERRLVVTKRLVLVFLIEAASFTRRRFLVRVHDRSLRAQS